MDDTRRSKPVIKIPGKVPIANPTNMETKPVALEPVGVNYEMALPRNPLACSYDHFPPELLAYATENKITPLKWRIQKGEYILFSTALQKYHVPLG